MSLIEFFNDPNSIIVFFAGIGVSVIFLIAVAKQIYGPNNFPNKKDRITLKKYNA